MFPSSFCGGVPSYSSLCAGPCYPPSCFPPSGQYCSPTMFCRPQPPCCPFPSCPKPQYQCCPPMTPPPCYKICVPKCPPCPCPCPERPVTCCRRCAACLKKNRGLCLCDPGDVETCFVCGCIVDNCCPPPRAVCIPKKPKSDCQSEKGKSNCGSQKGNSCCPSEKGRSNCPSQKGNSCCPSQKGNSCCPSEKGNSICSSEKGRSNCPSEKGTACCPVGNGKSKKATCTKLKKKPIPIDQTADVFLAAINGLKDLLERVSKIKPKVPGGGDNCAPATARKQRGKTKQRCCCQTRQKKRHCKPKTRPAYPQTATPYYPEYFPAEVKQPPPPIPEEYEDYCDYNDNIRWTDPDPCQYPNENMRRHPEDYRDYIYENEELTQKQEAYLPENYPVPPPHYYNKKIHPLRAPIVWPTPREAEERPQVKRNQAFGLNQTKSEPRLGGYAPAGYTANYGRVYTAPAATQSQYQSAQYQRSYDPCESNQYQQMSYDPCQGNQYQQRSYDPCQSNQYQQRAYDPCERNQYQQKAYDPCENMQYQQRSYDPCQQPAQRSHSCPPPATTANQRTQASQQGDPCVDKMNQSQDVPQKGKAKKQGQCPKGRTCVRAHNKRLHRLQSLTNQRKERLSDVHRPIMRFRRPPCPIRETVASILKKKPPSKCESHNQELPAYHEFCMADHCPAENRYPLLTRNCDEDMPRPGQPDNMGGFVEQRGAKRKNYHR